MMLQGMILMQEKVESFMQILKPQQGADTFVERVFVSYQNDSSFNSDVSFKQDSERSIKKLQIK